MAIAYIGLGSNIGDRNKNIKDAIFLMQEQGIRILKISSFIETDPVGGPPQEKFLNAVVKVRTENSPKTLLLRCQWVERQLGRVRTVPNGPRTIDLDILLYDHIHIHTPQLTIPHPRMFAREFVMIPLREIEPGFCEELHYANDPEC